MAVVESALGLGACASPSAARAGEVPRGTLWVQGVNAITADLELGNIRDSVRRDRPFGTPGWTLETAKVLNLEHILRSRGRPRGVKQAAPDKTT